MIVAVAFLASTALGAVKIDFHDAVVERDKHRWQVVAPDGRILLKFQTEPGGLPCDDLAVTNVDGRIDIDARALFARGLRTLVVNTCSIPVRDFAGKDAALKTEMNGPRGLPVSLFFEGRTRTGRHYWQNRGVSMKGRSRIFEAVGEIPADIDELHLRFDLSAGKSDCGVWTISSTVCAPYTEMPVLQEQPKTPQLIFYADFDGTATAFSEKIGRVEPLTARGLEFIGGIRNGAVRISKANGSMLEYPAAECVDPAKGTVALWIKREWANCGGRLPWRSIFSFPQKEYGEDAAAGNLWFWWWESALRVDIRDDRKQYPTWNGLLVDDQWHHLALSWGAAGAKIYVDGERCVIGPKDSWSPLAEALKMPNPLDVDPPQFHSFFVGCRDDGYQMDGLIDDLRIYSDELDPVAIRKMFDADNPGVCREIPNYAKFFDERPGENPYVGEWQGEPGNLGELELVEEVNFDALPPKGKFRQVGGGRFRELNGVRYYELDSRYGSRLAYRFDQVLKTGQVYCVEIDWPDDRKRTVDVDIQPRWDGPGGVAVGFASGDEFPNSGEIRTHRCIVWPVADELVVVLMTAQDDAPAAVSAIRICRVVSNKLPRAQISAPETGSGRTFALYYEDPSISYGFGDANEDKPENMDEMTDRVAAEMRYYGENLFVYPGAWYHGVIGRGYSPRQSAPHVRSGWYEKFDREGLGMMPSINMNTMPVNEGTLNRKSMRDGSLHRTVVAIHDTGLPNPGRWHGSPPNFNIAHPETQAYVESVFDQLLEEGSTHSSFKGIVLHVTKHGLISFGCTESGYNDYAVEAFAADRGIVIPVDKADPLRGKRYAEWIRENAWDAWLDWRCALVAGFYRHLAEKLAKRRPDARLVINCFVSEVWDYRQRNVANYIPGLNRGAGIDTRLLADLANVVICQHSVPMAGRFVTRDRENRRAPVTADESRWLAHESYAQSDDFKDLKGVKVPWVFNFDVYWETDIGCRYPRGSDMALSCDWMTEVKWRAGTINAAGRNSLRQFAVPLRYGDVLGFAKGGFLSGNYGMDAELISFMRSYRALPDVVFDDVLVGGEVVVRQKDIGDKTYFYVINTDSESRDIQMRFPEKCLELSTGKSLNERFYGEKVRFCLKPYELRSFVAPRFSLRLIDNGVEK